MTVPLLFPPWFRGKALCDLSPSTVCSWLSFVLSEDTVLCWKAWVSANSFSPSTVACVANCLASLRFYRLLLGLVSEDYCQERVEDWERERSCRVRSSIQPSFTVSLHPVASLPSPTLSLCSFPSELLVSHFNLILLYSMLHLMYLNFSRVHLKPRL